MTSQENLYTILHCNETATVEELKRNYQMLAKRYHPDKNSGATNEIFQKIDQAWKVLRDPEKRKLYDASLMQNILEERPLIYAEIAVDDLNFDEEGVAHYPCRCGNVFLITKAEMCDNEVVVECIECTNCVSVRS